MPTNTWEEIDKKEWNGKIGEDIYIYKAYIRYKNKKPCLPRHTNTKKPQLLT